MKIYIVENEGAKTWHMDEVGQFASEADALAAVAEHWKKLTWNEKRHYGSEYTIKEITLPDGLTGDPVEAFEDLPYEEYSRCCNSAKAYPIDADPAFCKPEETPADRKDADGRTIKRVYVEIENVINGDEFELEITDKPERAFYAIEVSQDQTERRNWAKYDWHVSAWDIPVEDGQSLKDAYRDWVLDLFYMPDPVESFDCN